MVQGQCYGSQQVKSFNENYGRKSRLWWEAKTYQPQRTQNYGTKTDRQQHSTNSYNAIIWSQKRPERQQLQYRLKRTTEKHVFDSEWKHYKYVYRKKASVEFTKWSGHRVLWIFIHEKF